EGLDGGRVGLVVGVAGVAPDDVLDGEARVAGSFVDVGGCETDTGLLGRSEEGQVARLRKDRADLEGKVTLLGCGRFAGCAARASAGAAGEDEGTGAGERNGAEGGLARAGEDAHVAPC